MATNINKSILNKNNFRLLIDKVPTVEYYVQTVTIPGMQFTEAVQAAGVGIDVYFPGDKVSFETLSVKFLIDEDLENYKEIYNWINAIVPIADPTDYKNYTNTVTSKIGQVSAVDSNLNQYSDITLVINTNKNIPNRYFRFYDCFPISLGGLELQSGGENEPVSCEVTFRFSYYNINTSS